MAGATPEGRDDLAELRARLSALEARENVPAGAGPQAPPPHRRPVRAFFSALFIVVACVFVPLSALAVWVDSEVGDTGRYVATVAPSRATPPCRTPPPTGSRPW